MISFICIAAVAAVCSGAAAVELTRKEKNSKDIFYCVGAAVFSNLTALAFIK